MSAQECGGFMLAPGFKLARNFHQRSFEARKPLFHIERQILNRDQFIAHLYIPLSVPGLMAVSQFSRDQKPPRVSFQPIAQPPARMFRHPLSALLERLIWFPPYHDPP